jgi:hypothetical protein
MVLALSDPEQTIVRVRTERGNGEYIGRKADEVEQRTRGGKSKDSWEEETEEEKMRILRTKWR